MSEEKNAHSEMLRYGDAYRQRIRARRTAPATDAVKQNFGPQRAVALLEKKVKEQKMILFPSFLYL